MRPEQSRIIRDSLGGKETIRKKRRPIDSAVLKKTRNCGASGNLDEN
jgi:hypothetical protein